MHRPPDGRPDDIPQDVWDAAVAVYAQLTVDIGEWHDKVHIARALIEERERCARVAEGFEVDNALFPFMEGVENHAAAVGQEYAIDEIAAAIRKGAP